MRNRNKNINNETEVQSGSTNEILKYALENGMLDLAYMEKQIEMKKREEILKNHPYKIWEGNDGKWRTYLPDEKKGRVLKKRNTEEEIKDAVVEYYNEEELRPCFRKVYREWIDEKEQFEEVGKNSITRYDSDFERFFPVDEPFCQIRLCNINDSDLERFIKRTIKDKHLSAKSYAGLRLILTGVFKYAKREKYTDYSIATFFRDLSLPQNIFKRVKKDMRNEVFTDTEARMLIQYFYQNATIVNLGLLLQFLTGIRVGELSSIKRENNYKKNVLKIGQTEYTYYDKKLKKRVTLVKDYPKTDNSIRDVLLPKQAQDVLDIIIGRNPRGEYLFMKDKKRITGRMFNYYLKRACLEVGIAPRSTHKVRKTYGSVLLSKHVDESLVLNQMGHKNISTTRGYYYYNISDDDEKMEKINDVVSF